MSDKIEIPASQSVERKETPEERRIREERESKEFWEGVRKSDEAKFKRQELSKQYAAERKAEQRQKTMNQIILLIVILGFFGLLAGGGYLMYKKLGK